MNEKIEFVIEYDEENQNLVLRDGYGEGCDMMLWFVGDLDAMKNAGYYDKRIRTAPEKSVDAEMKKTAMTFAEQGGQPIVFPPNVYARMYEQQTTMELLKNGVDIETIRDMKRKGEI